MEENKFTCKTIEVSQEKKSLMAIERSLMKTYRKDIWSKFIKGVKEYELIEAGDKIAVAISGGKDSLLLAKLLQQLKRNMRDEIELEFIAMDPGYHPQIRELLKENCDYLGIPIHLYESNIFQVAEDLAGDNPCYMCARMRRGSLYAKAQELGCNKLALGHHFNDVIETTMLNVLCGANFKTMRPKLRSDNFEGIELIRPMYQVEEKDIIRFIKYTGIEALNCACMVTAKRTGTKRQEIKDLIEELKKTFDNVDISIFRAGENVELDGVLAWKKDGLRHSFLDEY